MKFRVDIRDVVLPNHSVSVEQEDIPGMGSIALAEDGKPWLCKMLLSERALRALARGALALADVLRDEAIRAAGELRGR